MPEDPSLSAAEGQPIPTAVAATETSPPVLRAARERLPLELRAALVRPARKAVIGLALVAAAGILFALWWAWSSRAESRPAPVLRRSAGQSAVHGHAAPGVEDARPMPEPAASVTVHIAGQVRRPGVVRLRAGSRVGDAVESAGGATAKAALASVNLARVLADGEQIVVLKAGEAPVAVVGGAAGSRPGGSSTEALVDLNTATLEQLDGLPGVGPVLAQRILDWRTRNGRFSSVGELQEVAGIGEAKFADLRPRVHV